MHHIALLLLVLLFPGTVSAYQQIEFIREFGDAGKNARERLLNGARAIALHDQTVFVADTDAHRIVVITGEGEKLRAWGSKGDKPGQFRSPAGIATDGQGRVYVSDTGNHRIQVFNAAGNVVGVFGEKGSGPREFNHPSGIAVQRGFLYVADKGNSRIQVLSADGIFIRQITLKNKKEEMKEPVAVSVDVQNRIAVLDADDNSVRMFDHGGELLSRFGAEGSGTDGFDEPQGMALDSTGNFFIADTGNAKLKKFDRQGRLVASFGSEGRGPGQFREAAGVAVDGQGRIYVLDAGKNTLQVFLCEQGDAAHLAPSSPPAGVELRKEVRGEVSALAAHKGSVWAVIGDSLSAFGRAGAVFGKRGSEPGMFKNPRALALDLSGNIWVVDTGNDRLQKFGPDGSLMQVIGKGGSKEGELDSPAGMAIGPNGSMYIADTGNKRVQVFNSKGMFLGQFGKPGKMSGQFAEPVDIAVDRTGHLYVVDRGNDRIAKYDDNGTLLWESGRSGERDGEFRQPANILVSDDNEVYVLDAGNGRIQLFDAGGKFLRAFGSKGKGPGELKSPQGLALEAGTLLYVGDRGNKRVQLFALRHTPSVPRDVTAEARPNEIQLNWKNGSESYREQSVIYRSDSAAGSFKAVGTTADPFFVDRELPSNTSYFYRVASTARGGNESAVSPAVSAVTPKLVPGAPKKVKIDALEKQITISWLPNLEPFVSSYRIYRTRQLSSGFELAGQVERTVFVDSHLADETFYYYKITAVGKEGDESPATEVVYTSTPKALPTLPPLEIAKVELEPLFASAYKYYESHPIGRVVIKNNTGNLYAKVKLSFSIRDFMDYPTEIELEQVQPQQQVEVHLKPVFSNRILDVTENTPVQSKLALTYYEDGEPRTAARSYPVTLYERHAMVWDQKAKLGAYVTLKDPPVADFSRALIAPYVDSYPGLHPAIVYARAAFDSLGVLGLKYIVDPSSPFQAFSETSVNVDYLQYPRDTLSRKSGDCDDLSILFAAMMENIGIGTAFIDVPGHVFVMVNTGVPEKDRASLGFPDSLVIADRGTIWIPVEMTLVGSPFSRAWQKAAEEYREWSAKGEAEIVNTQKAWELFKPVTLPATEARVPKVTPEEIEAQFKDELETLGRQRLAHLSAEYLAVLKKEPNDASALAQLGIVYGENGLYQESLEQFQKLLATDKTNSLALNNIGNINFLQERLEDAKIAYEASLAASPQDAGVMTNLARVLLRLGRKKEARKAFLNAADLDPRVLRKNRDIAKSLGM